MARLQEKVEYLFIDMEWNQKAGTQDVANREPIQIGLIGANEHLDEVKRFGKSIRLDDVFKRVKESFQAYKYVVVWTMGTYDLFKQSMERAGIKMPRHKVLVLQDILNLITMAKGKMLGFETALIRAKIPYEKAYLHYSKNDVQYLYELFKKVYADYQKLTEDEECIVNKTSRVIHLPGCRYVCYSDNNVGIGEKSLIFKGYRPCSCCGTEENWRRIFWKSISTTKRNKNRKMNFRKLPLTDNNIALICNHFNIKCNISERIVFLTTNCGYWRVYLDREKVDVVYHCNQRIAKQEFKKKKKCNEGFHKQEISKTNFYDVVQYIYYHDKNAYANRRKSRVEILLEQIEKDLH